MKKQQKPKGHWTFERCKEEALKYKTRTEFQKGSNGAYDSAQRNNWLEDIYSHMIEGRKPNGHWTFERCKEEALKYNTRTEFQKGSPSAYDNAVKKYKCIDEICEHMKIQGNLLKRFLYIIKFPDGSIYIGLTDNFNRRKQDHFKKGTVYKYIQKTNTIPIFELISEKLYTKEEVSILEKKLINDYREKGYKVLNIKNGGQLGGNIRKWTFEKCKEEALKYKTRTEFIIGSNSAYNSARKNKWLDEICKHMIKAIRLKPKWTFENCQKEASKYSSKSEFRKNSKVAYQSAVNNKWIDEICKHMIEERKPNGHWTFERCKKEALKYKTKSEFRNIGSAYDVACKNKWLKEICSHMPKRISKKSVQ